MRRFFAVLLPFLVIFLGGCAQTAPNLPEDTDKAAPLLAELRFSEDAFSHSRNAPDAVCYSWLGAQLYQFRPDDANAVFFEKDPIVSSKDEEHGRCSVYTATGASGARLVLEYNSAFMQSLYYRTPWYGSKTELLVKDYPADIGAFNMNNVDKLPQEELAFATVREAETAVKDILERLGCSNLGAAEVYALSPATLAALERADPQKDDDGRELPLHSWTEEDACYYLVFRCEYDGLVFSREGLQVAGTNIAVHYSARGVECLEIQSPLEVTGIGERMDMPSPEDAKAIVTQKYDSMLLTNDITVEEISLEYIMVPGEGRLVPSWRVIILKDYGEYQYQSHLRFNALTGKQMTW